MWSPNDITVSYLEAVKDLTLLSTPLLDVYKVIEHLHMLWMGIWMHPYNLTPMQMRPKFWKTEGKGESKRCCGVSCLEAVNHLTLLSTPILHVNKVIEHLHMLWMVIQAHPYTVMIVVLQ